MKGKQYTYTRNAVFNLGYHITWCPKFRKPFLLRLDQTLLRKLVRVAAIKVHGVIENMEIMPDHVHVFIRLKRNHVAISRVVQSLKGYTSFSLRKACTWMKQYKALWSPGYFVESVGNMSEKVVKKYINNQRSDLKPSYRYATTVKKYVTGIQRNSVLSTLSKHDQFTVNSCSVQVCPKVTENKNIGDTMQPQQKRVQLVHIFPQKMVRYSPDPLPRLCEEPR